MEQGKKIAEGIVLFIFLSSCSFAQVYIDITGTGFSPTNMTVDQGTTVTWINEDGNIYDQTSHIVASDFFSSNDLGYGDTLSYTFTNPGSFVYWSGSNDSQTGTITVIPVTSTQTTQATTEAIPIQTGYTSPMGQMTYVVAIKDSAFNPSDLTVPVGSTVDWVNNDGNAWSSTQYNIKSYDDSFSSGKMDPGAIYSYVFNNPGIYGYSDTNNFSIAGTITVSSGPVSTTTTTTLMTTSSTTTTTMPTSVQTVVITDDGFTPANIQVPLGSTVTWVNDGQNNHRVVTNGDLHAGSESEEPQIDIIHEMEFASQILEQGDIYSHTFIAPGIYYYYDDFNASMKGTISVG